MAVALDIDPVVERRPNGVDLTDMKFVLFLGFVAAVIKVAEASLPSWHMGRITTDDMASVLTVGYILFRARRRPEKLDDWGLTARLTLPAILSAVVLGAVGLAMVAAGGIAAAGKLSFDPAYIPQMIEYVPAAFPQQFAMCSVGLATLATFQAFRGCWRLPLAVGLVFSLAHFWTPAHLPGTIVPVQMILTFPAGFLAAFHFLKFRSILPLTAIHAIMYPLLHNWIEMHL